MQEIERLTVLKNSFKDATRSPEGSFIGLFEVMEMCMSLYCVTFKSCIGLRSRTRSFLKIVLTLAALMTVMSCAVANAQTATTTNLLVTPTSTTNGSVFAMTATVTTGTPAIPLTSGTVTFRDTYNGITQVLGTVQVQSAHGIKGNAVLQQPLGGIGTHSVVATFNAPKTFSSSSSVAEGATVTGLYATTASLVNSGGSAGNWSLTTTIVGIGSTILSPTGTVSLLDTSNANLVVGTGGLGTGTVGHQIVGGSNSPVAVGNKPQSVVAGDFNGDGFIDLAVLNASDKNISILTGNGTGKFTASATKYATGNGPVALVVADFDGDGNLDLAVANSTDGTVSILLGNGDGTFNTRVSYSVTPLNSSTSLAVADFNTDGIPDLAVAGSPASGGAVVILKGDGNGAFTNITSSGIAVGNAPSSIAVGDFNGDGSLDFAVANKNDNSVSVMRGDGSGTNFTASSFSITSGASPTAIIAVDLNADGHLDLVVSESNNSKVDIYKGSGTGTFSLQGSPATGSTPMSIVAGDFNADGNVDLAVANYNSATASVLFGNGDLTFQGQVTSTVGTSPISITTGDFNGDGSFDLAVANNNSKNVSILLNQVTDTASVLITGISIPGSGNHKVEASYPGDSNFNGSTSGTVSLAATKVTTTTLVSASTSPIYGQQVVLTATLQTTPPLVGGLNPTGNVTFKDGTTTLSTVAISGGVATLNVSSLTAGTHSITAIYAGDGNFVGSTSSVLPVTVSKATPVITWANPAPISYGMLLSSTQLNATASTPGTFSYSSALFTSFTVGTYSLGTVFTPTDSTDYNTATASVSLTVNPATPQISWATPAPITYGTALTTAQLNATVAVYNMVPLTSFYNVYGIYTDGTSYSTGGFDAGGSAYSSNLLGTSVTWNNITFPLGPTNAPDAVSSTTISLPPGRYTGLAMLGALVNNATPPTGTFVVTYTDGTTSSTTQSLSDWVYPLNYAGETNVTCVPYRNESNGTKDGHLTCVYGYQITLDNSRIVQSVTLPANRDIVMLAMALVAPVPGSPLVYTPPLGTVLPTGENTLSVAFTPTDQVDYTSATGSVLLLVNPANATTLTWPTPAPITYGTALTATQLNAQAFTIPGTTSVSLSSYYRVNAFQSDGSTYATGGFDNGGNSYSSNLVGSSVVWSGQTFSLGPANLPDAVTSTTIALPQGNFAGLSLIGGATTTGQITQPFIITYTDGTTATVNVSLSSWIQSAGYTGETIVSTTAYRNNGGGGRTTGNTYLYGYQIPLDSTRIVQSVTLPNNRNIVIVAMSLSTSTTPTAVPGSYVYTPPAATVLPAGTASLSVLFTPTNPSFGTATKTVTLQVNKAPLTVVANNETVVYGSAVPAYTSSISGFVNGDTQSSAVTGSPTLTTTPAAPTAAGVYPITASLGTLASSNYSFTFPTPLGALTISQGTPTIAFTVANQTYGAAPFTVTATSNSAGAFTYSVVSGPATISGNTVTLIGAGMVVLQAAEAAAGNYAAATKTATFTVAAAIPGIVFAVPNQTYGVAPFTVSATSNSTGAFTYSVVSGPATISGNTVTITGAGTVVLQASEAADSNYIAATKNATFTIAKNTPTIAFTVSNQTYGVAPFAVTATSNSTGAFTYSVVSGPATISGNTVTITGAGTVILRASEAADSNYVAGTQTATFTVGKNTPTIAFTVSNQTYGAAPFTVAATSNSTGAFTYSVVSGPATISGNTVTLTGAGTVVLQASEAADSNYVAGTQTATFTVGKNTPTIAFTVSNQTYGAAPFTVAATSNSTGAFTYSVVSGPATISGNTVTLTGAGTVVLQASEAADSNYIAATKTATFTVAAATPTIAFTVSNQTYGAAPFAVAATSNSTGAFTYSVVSGPATISGNTVTLTGAGTVVLKASEAADSNYVAATQTATFTVGKNTPTIGFTVSNQTYGAAPVRGGSDVELDRGLHLLGGLGPGDDLRQHRYPDWRGHGGPAGLGSC